MAQRAFYGWYVVAGAFAVTWVGFGSAYTFSAFVESLQRDFAASRGSVSLVFSLAGCLYFALGVISGPLADRWGARRVTVTGMLLVGLGLCAAGAARTLAQVYVAYGLGIGLGVGFSYVPALGAAQRWFVKRRGFASGLAVSGIGVGTLVMPPLAAWLIVAPAGFSLREAVRTRRFASLYAACLACSFGLFVPFVHLIPFALDHGVPQASAVLLLGAVGVGSTAGRFLLGGLADTLGRQFSLMLMFAGMALALGVWALSVHFWGLALFALVYGVFYGGFVAILPALVMDYFGGRHVSSIIGVLYTSVAAGTLVGPSAAGYAFDLRHSYLVPILFSIAANVIAALIVMGIPRAAAATSTV